MDLPDSVTELRDGAFSESALETITWSDNLRTIGYSCFRRTNLREVTLPSQLTELLSGVFFECTNLEKVTFNEGLQRIEGYCFDSTGLKEVVLPSTVLELQQMSFSRCQALQSVVLNEGLVRVDPYAFAEARLTEVVIPSTVTQITGDAFYFCLDLKKVMFEGDAPEGYEPDKWNRPLDYIVYYHEGAKGFTSPECCGFKTEIW